MLCEFTSLSRDRVFFLWLLTNISSSGLLLYAALVDLLAEDFLSEEANATLTKKDRKLAFGCVLLGGETSSITFCIPNQHILTAHSDGHVDCWCFRLGSRFSESGRCCT